VNWKCFFKIHDWNMWEAYIDYYTGTFRFGKRVGENYTFSEEGQRRSCKRCGYTKKIIKH